MFSVESSIFSKAAPSIVWVTWKAVSKWPKWDKDLQACELSGRLANGSTVTLQPNRGPLIKSEIVNCVAGKHFTNVGKLPLWSSIAFKHELNTEAKQVKITHKIEFHGIVGILFYFFLGSSMKRNLDSSLQNLRQIVEGKPK